jgi:hypothetical protein
MITDVSKGTFSEASTDERGGVVAAGERGTICPAPLDDVFEHAG